MEELIAALIESGVLDSVTAGMLRGQLDDEFARTSAEGMIYDVMLEALQAQQDALFAGDLPETITMARDLFDSTEQAFSDTVLPAMMNVAEDRAASAAAAISTSLSGDALEAGFMRINESVLRWANTYYLSLEDDDKGSVPNLTRTSRSQFLDIFELWNRGQLPVQIERAERGFLRENEEMGLPDLINALESTFGPTRAENIAATETTRIFSEATEQAGQASDTVIGFGWLTAADEITCVICRPMHRRFRPKSQPDWGGVSIPAHPRCRCDKVTVTELTRGGWR